MDISIVLPSSRRCPVSSRERTNKVLGPAEPGAFQLFRVIATRATLSEAMSKDLKRRGFNFVGSTICYAFMQAVGMVNDHTVDCFRYSALT